MQRLRKLGQPATSRDATATVPVLWNEQVEATVNRYPTKSHPKLPRYVVDHATGCWQWIREINNNGYAMIWVDNKHIIAHRFYYAWVHGAIPKGMYCDHLCHNRACVNPAHITLVTPAGNTRSSYQVKLNAEHVATMKRLHRMGVTPTELAEEFGIHRNHVYNVLDSTYWKDVQ